MGREAVGGDMAAVLLVREKMDVWKLVKEKMVCLVRKIVGVLFDRCFKFSDPC